MSSFTKRVCLQGYHLHMKSGAVLDYFEPYDWPAGKGLIAWLEERKPIVLHIGDAINGYIYVPMENIEYISTGIVEERTLVEGIHYNKKEEA